MRQEQSFLESFAAEKGLTIPEADVQWSLVSEYLPSAERRRIEAGGALAGASVGQRCPIDDWSSGLELTPDEIDFLQARRQRIARRRRRG